MRGARLIGEKFAAYGAFPIFGVGFRCLVMNNEMSLCGYFHFRQHVRALLVCVAHGAVFKPVLP